MSGRGFDPDATADAFDDHLAEGEADAGTGVLVPRVQSLEHNKELAGVRGVNTDAVVLNTEDPGGGVLSSGDVDLGGMAGSELDGV